MKKTILLLSLFLSTILFAQTNVSGPISSDTTWSLDNSPYTVTGNVLVPNDVILTIEAGVTVMVNSGLYIKVQGTIKAIGSEFNKIIFTSNTNSKDKGDWDKLWLASTSTSFDDNDNYLSGTILDHCIISYANEGLRLDNSSFYLVNSEISKNKIGVSFKKVFNSIIINNNFIDNNSGTDTAAGNEGYGVGSFTYTKFLNNIFQNNTGHGLSFGGYRNNSNNNLIKNNISKNNGSNGMNFQWGDVVDGFTDNIIEGNIIYNNGGNGITIGRDSNVIKKNIIINNRGSGINISGTYIYKGLTIENNILSGNSKYALDLSSNKNSIIRYNSILNSGGSNNEPSIGIPTSYISSNNNSITYNTIYNSKSNAIELRYGPNIFNYNNFVKTNGDYVLKIIAGNSSAINAENNYWGTSTESEIQAAIYDFNEDFELGTVDYSPFLSTLNITAPISPPSNVTKTVSGSGVELNWSANGESDIAGYKLHYGSPTGYSYTTTVDLGNVTTHTLTGGDINTEYSITAYDSSKDGTDDMVDGNESWYSIADQINIAPILSDDTVSTEEDNSIDITLNVNDPDSSQITYTMVKGASNGTVRITNKIATYTPNENFNGDDSFTITANDGELTSNIATISITVNAINDAPIANNDLIVVNEGATITTLKYGQTTLLFNDSDIENNSLTASIVSQPVNGALTLNTDGTFSYEHDGSETTSDNFFYKINDGDLDSSIAFVNITIDPKNDNLPTDILLSNNSIQENKSPTSYIGQLSVIDLDLPSDSHTYELVNGVGDDDNSSFSIISSRYLYTNTTLDYEAQETLSIRIKATDENNQSFEKLFTIEVINVNDINITSETTNSYCSSGSGIGSITINSVDDSIGTVTYNWIATNGGVIPSGQENSQNLTGLVSGIYNLSVSDNNFTFNKSFEISLIPQYNDLSICYVSSDDSEVTKNRIYLDNQGSYNVAFYEVLRESNIAGVYTNIGTISSTENSFLDDTSNNLSQSYNYKVRLIDNCGMTSLSSDLHKTILLQSSVAVNGTVNLNWSDYEGKDFSTYNIYKNTNNEGFQLIGSVSSNSNSFNDTTANVTDNNYEYYISISVNNCLTEIGSQPSFKTSNNSAEIKSNYQNIGSSLSLNSLFRLNKLSIYPNPANIQLNIEVSSDITFLKAEIYSAIGQMVLETKETTFSIEKLAPSTYFIMISTSEGVGTTSFIKQ